jgi:hypothetical protein
MTFRGSHPDELISASLSGDLTDAERAQLDAHLARCETCRATLAAFKAERRILSGLPVVDPPRDLSARVRGGIESGRFAGPWWGRPGSVVPLLASAAVFAAAVLAVVVFGNLNPAPVGQETSSPQASVSIAPSGSVIESVAPSVLASAPPLAFLGPGDLGYLSLNGGSLQPSRLTFINDATGASIDAGALDGPPIAAVLSPDGSWLAYIIEKGETGVNEVWALHLTDGRIVPLGCSQAAPFADRLAWAPDGRFLAYTLVDTDLGPNAGCPTSDGTLGSPDAWVFTIATGERSNITHTGNAYAASFSRVASGTPGFALYVSHAASQPWSELWAVSGARYDQITASGVFLPLVSPEGNRAIFWSGTMASSDAGWQFSMGGMPQLSGDFRSTGPASPWLGTPLFSDLTPVGGEAFASGKFTWGPDSDLIAFWDGAWTGVPQSADGTYPSQEDVYVGRISTGLLSSASRIPLGNETIASIVAVALRTDGGVAVTVRRPSSGIGDPPSAFLVIASSDSLGVARVPPRWAGPAVFGH